MIGWLLSACIQPFNRSASKSPSFDDLRGNEMDTVACFLLACESGPSVTLCRMSHPMMMGLTTALLPPIFPSLHLEHMSSVTN